MIVSMLRGALASFALALLAYIGCGADMPWTVAAFAVGIGAAFGLAVWVLVKVLTS